MVNRIFLYIYSQTKRSFELMQSEIEYRILLVSKSLPIKKQTFAIYSFFSSKYKSNALRSVIVLSSVVATFFVMNHRVRDKYKSVYAGLTVVLFVLSQFSYPYTVPIIWIISVFLLCSVASAYCLTFCRARVLVLFFLFLPCAWILVRNRGFAAEWQWQLLQASSFPTEVTLMEYRKLYGKLNSNAFFLYNYGAWLHRNGYYSESLKILSECKESYDDYNVELLVADDYRQLGETDNAIMTFEYANAMVPSRFLPLYHEMLIYEEQGESAKACRIAKLIMEKPMKITQSPSVRKIKEEAKRIIEQLGGHD